MNQIISTVVDWNANTVSVTFDNGMSVDLNQNETNKLAGIFPANRTNIPLTNTAQNRVIFSPVIKEALLAGAISYADAYTIQNFTSRGYANLGYTGNNPLEDSFPVYWTFLTQYRITNNDPTAT